MDLVSHRIANTLVGNDRTAASLEATLVGPEIRVETSALIAVAGADLGARIDGQELPLNRPVRCRQGSVLRFGERRSGTRAYIAFGGGITVTPELGSRATHTLSRLGGFGGRAVAAGDRLPLGEEGAASPWRVVNVPSPRVDGGARLRVLPGPQHDHFSTDALETLRRTRFTITPQSDRMGYRLSGAAIPRADGREMISDAAFIGALQVPPSGDPILLMSDRQTTGGYPQIATVITADLPDRRTTGSRRLDRVRGVRAARRDVGADRSGGLDSCAPVKARWRHERASRWRLSARSSVGGAARWFVRADDAQDVAAAHGWCEEQGIPWFVLGGGSNVVIADQGFDGLVLQIAIEGISITRDAGDTLVRAGAGEELGPGRGDGRRSRTCRRRMPVRHSGYRRRHAHSERRRLRSGSGRDDRACDGLRLRRS